MRAVKLYSSKNLQFLTGAAGEHRLTGIMAIKQLCMCAHECTVYVLGTSIYTQRH